MSDAHILVVDDDYADRFMLRRAFVRAGLGGSIAEAEDGEDALDYLRRQGRHADARTPDLVLLDVNMPRMSGAEFLQEVRADPALAHLMIIVLSTSDYEKSIQDMYALGANAYLVKPSGVAGMTALAEAVELHLMQRIQLPQPPEEPLSAAG